MWKRQSADAINKLIAITLHLDCAWNWFAKCRLYHVHGWTSDLCQGSWCINWRRSLGAELVLKKVLPDSHGPVEEEEIVTVKNKPKKGPTQTS